MNISQLNGNKFYKAFLVISFLVIVFLVAELTGFREKITIDYIRQLFMEHKFIGSIVFISIFSLGNLLYIPGWIFLVGGVLAVGKFYGGCLAFAGGMSSSILSYVVVGFAGKDALRVLEKHKVAKKFFDHLDERPLRTIIVLRFIFQTAPFLNYALILSKVKFRDFFIGTFLGLPLPITLYCIFFEYLFSKYL
ncbi:MAG: VTT domain-containing protein [Bacteriovoracaceae bacterium]|nr:VTT domain-containing protein [Bacteriovoracaceae bacterium]